MARPLVLAKYGGRARQCDQRRLRLLAQSADVGSSHSRIVILATASPATRNVKWLGPLKPSPADLGP